MTTIRAGGSGASTFLALTDTPAAYTGEALKVVSVNADETALVFSAAGSGDVTAAGNNTFTGSNTFTKTTVPVRIVNTADSASVQVAKFEGDRATMAADDEIYASFLASDNAGAQIEIARVTAVAVDVTAGTVDGAIIWSATSNGTITKRLRLEGALIRPETNDGVGLGQPTSAFSDLFLADGGTINFNNSDVIITHSTNLLAFTGASSGYTFDATVSVSGNPVITAGLHSIWIPATAMAARTTNGAASGTAEMATNKNMFKTLDFDTTTQEFSQFAIRMPKSWNEGTVTFAPVWSHPATTTNFGVAFGLAGVGISNDDPGDAAFGTAQTSVDTGGTTNDIYEGPTSSAITIAGTPQAGDYVMFQINRTVADGGDTMAVDARLHGIILFYTIDAATDA